MTTNNDDAMALALLAVNRLKKGPKGDDGKPGGDGDDGAPGVGVEDIETNSRFIRFRLTDGTSRDIPRPRDGRDGVDGVGVESIRENPITRKATIELTNGKRFSFALPRHGRDGKSIKGDPGKDGRGITAVNVSDGNVVEVLHTDGSVKRLPLNIHQGRDGTDGPEIHPGFKPPRPQLGKNLDWYLDRNDGSWWRKEQGAWELMHRPAKGGVSGGFSAQNVELLICKFLSETTPVNNVSAYQVKRTDRALYVRAVDGPVDIFLLTAGVDADGYDPCPIEIKRSEDSLFPVNVFPRSGETIEGEDCRIININKWSLRLKVSNGNWKEY